MNASLPSSSGGAFYRDLLSLTVERPSANVCTVIAGLKDLCDLQSSSTWRGAEGSNPSVGRFQTSGPSNYRNGGTRPYRGSDQLGAVSLPKPVSQKSFGSTNSLDSAGGSSPMPPTPKYQSQFRSTSTPVEDKILNNIILSKLNKFSPSTYNDIRDFLYQILGSGDSNLTQMIRDFMQLVFRKAAQEDMYCSLYAKLLAEISARYAVILDEMHKLQENYMEIFEDIIEVEAGSKDYETFVAKNREKRYRQGYSQFLAELVALEILDLRCTENTFRKIYSLIQKYAPMEDRKALVDEYCDCLLRMARVMRKKSNLFFVNARASLVKITDEVYTDLTSMKDKYPSLTNKSRFILMDIYDILQGR